jgi:periplasmic mercuric ion binding protein
MPTVVLKIPTADCATCRLAILRALDSLGGMVEADVDLRTRQATVRFDPARTDAAEIAGALTAAGHPPLTAIPD